MNGSTKQIDWAEKIRDSVVSYCDNDDYKEYMLSQDESKFFIDNRSFFDKFKYYDAQQIKVLIDNDINFKSFINDEAQDKRYKEKFEELKLFKTKDCWDNRKVASLKLDNTKLTIEYQFNSDSSERDILLHHNFMEFGEGKFSRGGLVDGQGKLVEMCHVLLNKGIQVKVWNNELWGRVESADYKPENMRRIYTNPKFPNKFYVQWEHGNTSLQQNIKAIWGGYELAKNRYSFFVDRYDELRTLTNEFGFQISDDAKKLMQEQDELIIPALVKPIVKSPYKKNNKETYNKESVYEKLLDKD